MNNQRTIKRSVSIDGIGLQTGLKCTLTLSPSAADSGIIFKRKDLPDTPLLNLRCIDFSGGVTAASERRTTLGTGPLQVQTTEHLLAALSGLGVDNIVCELDSAELPGLDGSAAGFLSALYSAGIEEQLSPKRVLEIKQPVWCGDGESLLIALPDIGFKISYTMSYTNPGLGTRLFSIAVDEKTFSREIAPARTFCLEEEAMMLLKRGLGKGANYDNTLVIGKDGNPINNKFRFSDEPVRHKALDLIGDLYLLGCGIRGRIIAIKSGHRLNLELVRQLKQLI